MEGAQCAFVIKSRVLGCGFFVFVDVVFCGKLLGNSSMHCSTTYITVGIAGDLLMLQIIPNNPISHDLHWHRCAHG
jgi:uncharacterized membrane protein YuzA (DUF378 family)